MSALDDASARAELLARENARDAAQGITHSFARVNDLWLHVAACGEPTRPLMLFVHGFPEFWYEWQALLIEFGRSHYAVALDQRGFNLSDKPDGLQAYRPGRMVADLRGLLDHLGRERCVMVAHDWGGAIAWSFASAYPERLHALVAINAAHTPGFVRELVRDPAQQAASAYMNDYQSPDAEAELSRDGYRALAERLRESSARDWLDDARLARYVDAWSRPGALTAGLNYYRASPVRPPRGDDPGAAALSIDDSQFMVQVPTLVIWGERDHALLTGMLDGLEHWVPDLEIVRDPSSSHWIVHERPDFVIRTMRDWLARRLPS